MLLSTLLIGLSAAAATPHHTMPVEHRDGTVHATYHPEMRVAHRQVGMAVSPGKMGVSHCRWTAHVTVERRLAGADGTALLHPARVGDPASFSGEHPGDCVIARKPIAAAIARQDDKMRAHVRVVAEADAPRLRADLDRASRFAAR